MRIVLLQQPGSTSPLDRWLAEADPGVDIMLVTGTTTKRAADDLAPGTRRVLVDDYFSDTATSAILAEVAAFRPDRVLHNSEDDVVRAATIRSLFGLVGTPAGLAVQFRDKLHMKQLFLDAGLEPVSWADCRSADDLLGALDRFGRIVVKPRASAGARDVHVFDSRASVLAALTGDPLLMGRLHSHALIVEEYVEGDVFHVDAVLDGPEVLFTSVSRYGRPPHTFRDHPLTSAMVDEGSADDVDMRACVAAVARSLPAGHGVVLIHLETFRRPDGHVLSGEVGARLGGGMIKAAVKRAYGVDLSHESYLLGAGLRESSELLRRPHPARAVSTGWMLWTTGRPTVTETTLPHWANDLWIRADFDDRPTHSTDSTGGLMVEAGDEKTLHERMASLA